MDTNQKELGELLQQLDLEENLAKQTLQDIQLGDELMDQFDRIPVDPAMLSRVETRLRQAPAPWTKTAGNRWLEVAVMAASLLIVVGVTVLIKPSTQTNEAFESELDSYWQQAFVIERETSKEVDDMILSEVLQCWSDVEWEVDDILDPQDDSPPNPLEIGRSDWIGHFLGE